MSQILDDLDHGKGNESCQHANDVAALLHFSAYLAREAARLGIPVVAERARMIEQDLVRALRSRDESKG